MSDTNAIRRHLKEHVVTDREIDDLCWEFDRLMSFVAMVAESSRDDLLKRLAEENIAAYGKAK